MCRHHVQQVFVLGYLSGELAAELGQLVSQLHDLVAEFPIHSILSLSLVDVVKHPSDSVSLQRVWDSH